MTRENLERVPYSPFSPVSCMRRRVHFAARVYWTRTGLDLKFVSQTENNFKSCPGKFFVILQNYTIYKKKQILSWKNSFQPICDFPPMTGFVDWLMHVLETFTCFFLPYRTNPEHFINKKIVTNKIPFPGTDNILGSNYSSY